MKGRQCYGVGALIMVAVVTAFIQIVSYWVFYERKGRDIDADSFSNQKLSSPLPIILHFGVRFVMVYPVLWMIPGSFKPTTRFSTSFETVVE